MIILPNHDWLILLKQCCNLGWHVVYPVVVDTINVLKTLAQGMKPSWCDSNIENLFTSKSLLLN